MTKSYLNWIVAFFLVYLAIQSVPDVIYDGNYFLVVWITLCLAAAITLIYDVSWSRHLVHLVSIIVILTGIIFTAIPIAIGINHGELLSKEVVASLSVIILLAIASLLSSLVVHQYFKKQKNISKK